VETFTLVAVLVASTVAPGTSAPLGSVTDPTRLPLVAWPETFCTTLRQTAASAISLKYCLLFRIKKSILTSLKTF
jgi:hypothetical protein